MDWCRTITPEPPSRPMPAPNGGWASNLAGRAIRSTQIGQLPSRNWTSLTLCPLIQRGKRRTSASCSTPLAIRSRRTFPKRLVDYPHSGGDEAGLPLPRPRPRRTPEWHPIPRRSEAARCDGSYYCVWRAGREFASTPLIDRPRPPAYVGVTLPGLDLDGPPGLSYHPVRQVG
jgi:hypothetical protein